MYMIAVCDDEPEIARYIAKTIQKNFEAKRQPVRIDWHTAPDKLEQQFMNGSCYDALLLDIDMPGLNGIELCRHLRQHSKDTLVVFISNQEELVFQTFEVSPFRFIRKSHFFNEADKLCQDIITELDRRKDRYLRFSDEREGTVYSVNIKNLMYIEAYRKDCRLRSVSDEQIVRIRFSSLVEKLEKYDFILVHRSYLVNPHYIYRIENTEVVLDNNESLPMSRIRREAVREAFFRWYQEGI